MAFIKKFSREIYRYRAVLLRKRFDDNRNVKDMAVAACLLEEGEKELFNTMHYQPLKSKLKKSC